MAVVAVADRGVRRRVGVMTHCEAEKVFDRFQELLSEAEGSIGSAGRLNFRNGYYSPEPQLRNARVALQTALDMLGEVERACEVLG